MQQRSTAPEELAAEDVAGMARFLTPRNVNRYRRLASPSITDDERWHIMDSLDEEVQAFIRECRVDYARQPK